MYFRLENSITVLNLATRWIEMQVIKIFELYARYLLKR